MFRDGRAGRSMSYAVPAVQRKWVQTARALFRGTVRHKAMGRGRKGRKSYLSSLRCVSTTAANAENRIFVVKLAPSGSSSKHCLSQPHTLACTAGFPRALKAFNWAAETLNCSTKPASSHRCFQQRMGTRLVSEAGVEEPGSLQFHICLHFTVQPFL